MERGTSKGLEKFLLQAGTFQHSCKQNSEKGHRVIITGRLLALQGIEGRMLDNLERVELLPMDDEIQQQWFTKWEIQVGSDKNSAFQQFLADKRCPDRVRELAREPLLLYLLAMMHRDGKLTVEMFEGASGVGAKILIYEQSLEWVLTKQRKDSLNQILTAQETEGLRRILAEAGLCVVQSGGEYAEMKTIESRLKGDHKAFDLIQKARETHGDDALKNALAAFYLQPAAGDKGGSVEFTHKSFGEFLWAERLKKSLENWTRKGEKWQEFAIFTDQMDREIYDLFGYGGVTPEIVEYLMALLTASPEFQPVKLCQRLENFYLRWCDSEFIDTTPENLPQKKMLQMKEQAPETKRLGLQQVDIYAGLNVLILLFELHRYAQLKNNLKDKIAFFPCGEKDTDSFDNVRLLRIIGYSECIGIRGFLATVGKFLSGANLSGADLSGADLSGADLSRANLIGANLIGANLSRANLRGALLRGANLSRADLSGVILSRANLSRANLSRADLSRAILSRVNLSGANLEHIFWEKYTNWENIRNLATAKNVPEALKQQLGLS
ncbi:pentapeptide repeat-containing protein [Coleofasciculus sp. FACHB-SPT9]|uniref:pentapeptide repeat-containing protein n=1 Tax=Cyanophyceae TaxID=3028117 RepID=UPI001F550EB5|nr:pentapeptide repeat-containing protein [Coleofasciculus sp. FACHB-SPT9]